MTPKRFGSAPPAIARSHGGNSSVLRVLGGAPRRTETPPRTKREGNAGTPAISTLGPSFVAEVTASTLMVWHPISVPRAEPTRLVEAR